MHIGVPEEDSEMVFNRDITMNEEEAINMCKNSVGVISDRTIVSNHPWVTDLEEEMKQIEEEGKQELDYMSQNIRGQEYDDN